MKTFSLLSAIPLAFTLLVAWFAWSTLQATPPLAAERLRGEGLATAAAIEHLVTLDPTLRSLTRYTTPDIAYFALSDRAGLIRFHTNPDLVGHQSSGSADVLKSDQVMREVRERLGTGEEVYLLRTLIHPVQDELLLTLALHTYRADQVVRRAKTGVSIVTALTVALWGLTLGVFFLLRRNERQRHALHRREELAKLGELGAVMAHEIRNPLAGIKGFAQLLQRCDDPSLVRQHAAKIVSQSLRLETLVNDLLTFARDDRGKRRSLDLAVCLEECLALVGAEAATQGVRIELQAAPPVLAPVVAERIMQLLLNLLKNALQAMPDGGTLRVALRQDGRDATILVADSGMGIAPEQLRKIFDPFWTDKVNGTGLGLAICQKVAEEHGGRLSAASTLGQGTTFTLTLPLTAPEQGG